MSRVDPGPAVVLSNPGMGACVEQVGRALFEAGMLRRFATTLVDRPQTPWHRWAARHRWLGGQLARRRVTEFPDRLVSGHAARELIRLCVARFDPGGTWADAAWEWAEHGFDAWVAGSQLRGAQAVYAYEHAALQTFLAAGELGARCYYDVPAPEHDFSQKVRAEEIDRHPELDSAYERRIRARRAPRTLCRRLEWDAADLVFTHSEFTKSTYAAAGLDVSKVRIVPPGAPPVDLAAAARQERRDGSGPARFLFVGRVALHKGVHYLLDAWAKLGAPAGRATLDLIGEVAVPRTVLRNLPPSVVVVGRLPKEEVMRRYETADALVFPTLCDGFGMVVTEAFSRGLPVITTPRAGAAELVRHGVNGFVVPAGDAEALAVTLEWATTHREELAAMRDAARASAAAWQWCDYRRRLIEEIAQDLRSSGSVS